jgi:hypothetical protein
MTWLHGDMVSRGENLFSGDPTRQVTPDFRYSGGGEMEAVTDLASARAAIRLICEQGEGIGGAIYDEEGELSYFYRFEQLLLRRYHQPDDAPGTPSGPSFDVDFSAVYPIMVDANLSDDPEGSALRASALEFAVAHGEFLSHLTRALSGRPDLLDEAVGEMFALKKLARQLIQTPVPGTSGSPAAPIFDTLVR